MHVALNRLACLFERREARIDGRCRYFQCREARFDGGEAFVRSGFVTVEAFFEPDENGDEVGVFRGVDSSALSLGFGVRRRGFGP